jgi:hypothetical protein
LRAEKISLTDVNRTSMTHKKREKVRDRRRKDREEERKRGDR